MRVYESEEGIKVFRTPKGKFDVVDWVNYFVVVKGVETLSRAKKIARMVEDGTWSSLEDEYEVLYYDRPKKLLFPESKEYYGRTSPEMDVIEMSGPDVGSKAVILAHELGHVATGVEGTSKGEEAAWAWAIPRLVKSGEWTPSARERVIRSSSLRKLREVELAEERDEPWGSFSQETKELAGREVESFLSQWPTSLEE